jgi:nicotinate (nicotinamide) nucleotide adenylyltransferase
MASVRVALFGGSFNPPGLHHRAIALALAQRFDQVVVIPCGPRPDKESTNVVPSVYRAALADMAFAGLERVEVDLFDLEQSAFTRTHELDARFASRGEVWHSVGVDLISGGACGQSEIQRFWENGTQLWQTARFIVLTRPGHEFAEADLPPHAEVIELDVPGSSSEIRERLAKSQNIESLVGARPLAYIERYGLYRAPQPSSSARGSLAAKPFRLQADPHNPRVAEWAPHFHGACVQAADAHFIATVGGDGTMLRAIREHWRSRLPFYGVNAGHIGFLMNGAESVLQADFPPLDVIFRQLPMLYLEVEDEAGETRTMYGFNDAWVERATSQSAWLEVRVNGVTRLHKLVSDGALVSTAAGSTAYARSMGASPLLADTPAWLLVGSNVMEPIGWKSALLSTDTTVEIRSLDPERRPIEAFVDGHEQGRVRSLRARISRAASVELVFNATHDMAEKIAAIQFNSGSSQRGLPAQSAL